MRTTTSIATVAFFVILAGCAGSSAELQEEPSSATGAFEGDLAADAGRIEGLVTDPSLTPIPGATIGIVKAGITVLSDDAGAFAITNVPPGSYDVSAVALGYQGGARRVEISAGQTATVQFQLEPLAVKEPYLEVIGPFDGYFTLFIGTAIYRGGQPMPDDKYQHDFEMSEGTTSFVGEMRWAPASFASTQHMRMSFSYTERTTAHWFCTGQGPPTVQWVYHMDGGCVDRGQPDPSGLPDDQPKQPSPDIKLRTYAIPPAGEGLTPVNVAFQQKWTGIISLFHDITPEEGYTAFPDA